MGKKIGFTDLDRARITFIPDTGMSKLEISQNINCNHRTVKNFVHSVKTGRKTPKKII